MTPGLVSIIVPYYNYCMFIGYCLSRITDQTYENWECIVVDDASTREEHGALLNMAQYVIGKRCRIITTKRTLGTTLQRTPASWHPRVSSSGSSMRMTCSPPTRSTLDW